MRELCQELSEMKKSQDPGEQKKAMKLVSELRIMNERWNIPQLGEFIRQRTKELFFDL